LLLKAALQCAGINAARLSHNYTRTHHQTGNGK
jgi:hypothetical protein